MSSNDVPDGVERTSEYSTAFRYVCECGKTIYGESWDIQEAPKLHCPSCYEGMDIEMGWTDE